MSSDNVPEAKNAVPLPGALGRIGVIQPAPGLILEAEWGTFMPAGVAFPVTRVPLYGAGCAQYGAMNEAAIAAAAILANARADVIVHACGVGTFYRGPAAEGELVDRLSRAASGTRVIGMAAASMEWMTRLSARRIAVLTPYDQAINHMVEDYLTATGRVVEALQRFEVPSAIEAATLSDEAISHSVMRLHESAPAADLIWLPCSNVRTLHLLPALELACGIPVISSNAALLWSALDAIGVGKVAGS